VTEHEPEAVRGSGPVDDEVEEEAEAEVVETEVIEPTPLDPLQVAVAERDDYLDALRRLKAEFDNYRKRVQREQEILVARAAERLVKQLLPMLDDLERAVEAAVEHGELKLEDGVRLVHRSLANMLTREGLVEVDTDGLFDPHTQEALLAQPSEEPEGTVIQVLQKGYRLGDQVLRPARVVVSSGTPAAAESDVEG
jgi:molecular chaperone GrpE